MSDAEQLLQICRKRGDFVAGDDGFWMYWPTGNHGGLSEWMIRVILDKVERLNAPVQRDWERRVDEACFDSFPYPHRTLEEVEREQ